MTSAITSSVVYKINQLFLFNLMKFPRIHSDFHRKNFSFLSSAPELFYFSTFFGLDSFSFVSEYFPAINEFLCSIQNFIFAFFVTFFTRRSIRKRFPFKTENAFLRILFYAAFFRSAVHPHPQRLLTRPRNRHLSSPFCRHAQPAGKRQREFQPDLTFHEKTVPLFVSRFSSF